MNKGDDGIFEFRVMVSVDSGRGEGFLDDWFVNVGSDEEGDIRFEIVFFLEEFV